MSKRKRDSDAPTTVASQASSSEVHKSQKISGNATADRKPISYEDGELTSPLSKTAAVHTNAHSSTRPQSPYSSSPDMKAGKDEERPRTPPGPYSYTAEKREKLFSKDDQWKAKAKSSKKNKNKKRPQVDNTVPRTDPEYGQVGAIPLGSGSDEEDEGLQYLKMVRSEAQGLPRVVRAVMTTNMAPVISDQANSNDLGASHNDYEVEEEDEDGYYSDGTYIGRPDDIPEEEELDLPLALITQSYYHEELCYRFAAHHERMHSPPTAAAMSSLSDNHLISLPRGNKPAYKEWKALLRDKSPHPAQVASMDTGTIVRLLDLIDGQIMRCYYGSTNVPDKLARWTWALLGRLDSVETLSTEVGVVRNLAKTAVWVGRELQKKGLSNLASSNIIKRQELDDNDDEKPNVRDNEMAHEKSEGAGANGDDLVAAKARLIGKLEEPGPNNEASCGAEEDDDDQDYGVMATLHQALVDPIQNHEPIRGKMADGRTGASDLFSPNANTLATLDMIITVAGEFYGQRDLLESRLMWEEGQMIVS